MKKLFTLLAAVLLTLQMNAQLMDNSFSVIYDTFGAFQLEVIANFNCGSGPVCPHLDSVSQTISNDTLFIETYYLYAGIYPTLFCDEVDTIWANYNVPISTIVVCANGMMDTTQAQQGPIVVTETHASCAIGSPFPLSINEQSQNKTLLKVTEVLGRKSKGTKNIPLFYIYDDGTVEKKLMIE